MLALLAATAVMRAPAANVFTIGDSLTAEYDTIPGVPNFIDLPSDYAKVTVPGWESLSWVEVVRKTSAAHFNFGGHRKLPDTWSVPRMSGYEFNWAVPGVTSMQYREFVTATLWSDPIYFGLRQPLDDQLRNTAGRVVIWLGGNDFRATYGMIYDGGNSSQLISGLIANLAQIIDYVRSRNSRAQIVLASVPDPGASPNKQAAHPDPAKRARVTAAVRSANERIASLALQKRVTVADSYSALENLINGVPLYFGAVRIVNAKHEDNDPRYAFTRDGLHPNTPLQIQNARAIISAFNRGYNAGIPQITDAQALKVLGISPNQPFHNWLKSHGITNKSFIDDSDGDRLSQLVEYAFGLDPTSADADRLPATLGGPVAGIPGAVSVRYTPVKSRNRLATVKAQYSTDLVTWKNVPSTNIRTNTATGTVVAVIPPTSTPPRVRLRVRTIPPSGSTVSVASSARLN